MDKANRQHLDLQIGVVASCIANAYRDREQVPHPYTPEDFALSIPQRERVQTAEEQLKMFKSLVVQ